MTSLHLSDLESGITDSVTSSPRSEHHHDLHISLVRFMCSFGGSILPRPHDNQLRYVGGDTRIVAIHRFSTFSTLLTKLSKLAGCSNFSVKYQLPNEDLDALISVTTDEDMENMLEEYDRVAQNQNHKSARLRLFLFTNGEDSRASSISLLLDGSTNRENWFFDAINNSDASGSRLVRGRSEASSILSEVPDYMFGLENSDDTQPRELKPKGRLKLHDNVSVSETDYPSAQVVSSQFCSTSSVPIGPSMPALPTVKTKPEHRLPVLESKQRGQTDGSSETVEPRAVQQTGYSGPPMWHHVPDTRFSTPAVQQMPVYYVPVQQGSAPMQQPVPIQAQYLPPQFQVPAGGQIPVGYHQPVSVSGQVYGGPVRPVVPMDHSYDQSVRLVSTDGMNQQVYYGVRNAGQVPGYPGMMVSGGEELRKSISEATPGRILKS